MAAGSALARSAGPSPRLVAALGAVVFDDRVDVGERAQALQALRDAEGPEATDLLVRATGSSELSLQVEGALGLLRHGRFHDHRERVERLAATWPTDAGYRGDGVREALAGFHSLFWTGGELDDPELGRAHQELMFPTGEVAYHGAFRTLLHSGDAVAVGIALDYFASVDGLRQFLDQDAVDAYGPEVRAREVLR